MYVVYKKKHRCIKKNIYKNSNKYLRNKMIGEEKNMNNIKDIQLINRKTFHC